MKKRRLRQQITGIIMCVILVSCLVAFPGVKEKENKGQQSITEAQNAPQSKLERITVQTTPPCSSGRITVYAEDERVFSYYGKIEILNSGWNGRPIKIIVNTKGAGYEQENGTE